MFPPDEVPRCQFAQLLVGPFECVILDEGSNENRIGRGVLEAEGHGGAAKIGSDAHVVHTGNRADVIYVLCKNTGESHFELHSHNHKTY